MRLVESDSLTMRADLDPSALARLIESGDVLWIEPQAEPDTDDIFVRTFGGANIIETIEGYTGAGVVVEVVDKGLFASHLDLIDSSPVFLTPNSGPTDHGTSTYGIIFGSGTADTAARGMMPGQHGLFSSYLEIEDRYAHLGSLVADFGGEIQSNSWGSGISRRYTALSAELDSAILDHGVLVFQSQSNRGNPDSRPEAWAKNAISVGGINGLGTLDRSDDTWAGEASTGPALDGRIKPDLVLFNDGILTTSDVDTSSFEMFTGTSAATPAVAGHAGVMFEMWRAGFFHGGDAGAVPTVRPSVAMSRAIMINSARPYEFGHTADDLGRFRQGWGTPDLVSIWAGGPRRWISDEEAPLESGEGWSRVVTVAPGETSLAVTLAWTEPASMPFAVRTLINDLDLRLISPSGVVYLGNHGLHDGVVSIPGGDADSINNIENVFIDLPEAGRWQIDISARSVALDAHAATPEIDAAFAIVVTGVEPEIESKTIRFIGDIPEHFVPRAQTVIEFAVDGFSPDTFGEVRIRWQSGLGAGIGAFPLTQTEPGRYQASIGGLDCDLDYAILAVLRTSQGEEITFPSGNSQGWLPFRAVLDLTQTPPAEASWSESADAGVTSGAWERGIPAGGGLRWDPPFDADGDGLCWMTQNLAGDSDVSGGQVVLQTPYVSLADLDEPVAEFDIWVASDLAGTPGEESMLIEVSYGFGGAWVPLSTERSTFRWAHKRFPLDPTENLVALRFTVGGGASYIEAAVDGFKVTGIGCPQCRADVDLNGVVDLLDLTGFIESFNGQGLSADMDSNGVVDLTDLIEFITGFEEGCDP